MGIINSAYLNKLQLFQELDFPLLFDLIIRNTSEALASFMIIILFKLYTVVQSNSLFDLFK